MEGKNSRKTEGPPKERVAEFIHPQKDELARLGNAGDIRA